MSTLLSPFTIKDITFRNRIVVSPMCQYSAQDGFANDWHLVHLGSRAVGGAALVMQEATAVSSKGRISYGDLGIWKDEHIEFYKRITTFIHKQGAVAGIQLAHAGRKASSQLPWDGGKQIKSGEVNGWQTIAPSPIAFREGDEKPVEMSKQEIKKLIADFKPAAGRARQAGYKVVEIHAAHGYLINEFCSPLSNLRTDEYGGSFENRIRLLLEVTAAIKEVWPDNLPLFVRISSTDWADGGWNEDDSVRLAGILKTKGIDLIDCSSGGLVPYQQIPLSPGYQVPFAKKIKSETGILTAAVGLITTSEQADSILSNEEADLIFLARQELRNPYFPLVAAEELGDEIQWPSQYLRAKPHAVKSK